MVIRSARTKRSRNNSVRNSTESGRFSCHANGYGEGEYGEMYFYSDSVQQRHVEKGEQFIHCMPLKWLKPNPSTNVEITLYLFADENGSAGRDVTKIFTKQLTVHDDGTYFYGLLPSPSQ